jgi:acetate kinase
MLALIINSGSSSLKFQIINPQTKQTILKGLFDRISLNDSYLQITKNNKTTQTNITLNNHQDCIKELLNYLSKNNYNIDFISHRVVHGAQKYKTATLVTDEVINDIKTYSDLAPLHNPPNLEGILAFKKIKPYIPQIAVFDTAFHQTLKQDHYLYGLPLELYETYQIRKYGFHGTSHKYVSNTSCNYLKKDIKKLKIITAHMGNGISLCAIKNGISIDTSMGFTPLEGPIMGTRSGSFDPAIIPYLQKKANLTPNEIEQFLNKECGVKGILKTSSDIRDVYKQSKNNDKKANLILSILTKQITDYIGKYMLHLGGVDLIIFTGGIGEGAFYLRQSILKNLEPFGLILDKKQNQGEIKQTKLITTKNSKITAMVTPTNEELQIALESYELIKSKK